MSKMDYQELREAAEKAMHDDWGFDTDLFYELVEPSIVLALLDECETLATENAKLKTAHPQLFGKAEGATK